MSQEPFHRINVSEHHWMDWKWQMKNRLSSETELGKWINLTKEELSGIRKTENTFRWKITPYYASLMDPSNPNCPVRRQIVPHEDEFHDDSQITGLDPLEERSHSPVKNLIHSYRDRVALCITTECPSFCRFCLRKRMVGDGTQNMKPEEYREAITYIAKHKEIRDVLLTGGDPLTLSDHALEQLIGELRTIPHVDIIRFGTRYPVLNPFRITDNLCRILSKHHPVWVNTHFNHPLELTSHAISALNRLTDAGIPVGNQSVLLKGINDEAEILRELFHRLISVRVRPYYLYHAQLIEGTKHFRTTIEHGMRLIESLRGTLSGFAIPIYVLDTPHGKVPLSPHGYIERDGDFVCIRAYTGDMWREYNPG